MIAILWLFRKKDINRIVVHYSTTVRGFFKAMHRCFLSENDYPLNKGQFVMATNIKREIKLDFSDNMRVKFGTVDRLNPRIVYLSYRFWVEPIGESDYGEDFEIIKKNIRHLIRKTLSEDYLFSKKYIFDFLMNGDTLNEKKNKCVEFSIYLKQSSTDIVGFMDLLKVSKETVRKMVNGIEDEFVSNGFKVMIDRNGNS